MPNELTKALLVEGNAPEDAIGDALLLSLKSRMPVLRALVESDAVRSDVLARYLARVDTPILRDVTPLRDVVDQLPPNLCERLAAVPVRRDASTGVVDVAVADPGDPHPGQEIAFHLGAPVRLVRASSISIEEALRRLRPPERHLSEVPSSPPSAALGSEIPIPLTRRAARGEARTTAQLLPSYIPGPPPVPGLDGMGAKPQPERRYWTDSGHPEIADIGGILTDLRAAGSRDEVLELLLGGAQMVAARVAIFVVKRDGYLGWACTPEFGDRTALQSILILPDRSNVFETAIRDGLYLGSLPDGDAHAALLDVMVRASPDVAAVAVRILGKTAAVLVADELGDTLLATRKLDELAKAAGDALMRVVRMSRA